MIPTRQPSVATGSLDARPLNYTSWAMPTGQSFSSHKSPYEVPSQLVHRVVERVKWVGLKRQPLSLILALKGATGVETGVSSAGVSKADEGDTGLSCFFRNSSLRLAFLLIVEGLGFFLSKASSLESREKEKHEAKVRENLKALAI